MRLRILLGCAALVACGESGHGQSQPNEAPWYLSTGAIHRVTLKPTTPYWRFDHLSLDPSEAKQQMLRWKSEGIGALEIFAPEEGGNSYDGLDATDRFRLDPSVGSVDQFRRLVELAHSLGLRVVTFQNFGYSGIDSNQFHRAEDAVREGRQTPESRMFFWSATADASPPASGDSYFLVRPALPGYDPEKTEFWQWSARAHSWYWTRWPGKNAKGGTTHLPQYNWTDPAWPDEAQRVFRFWMSTEIDGMILDAVNWYTGANWQKLEDTFQFDRSKFFQPEGGGAFGDIPSGWISEGHFTNVYDYGLGVPWDKGTHPLPDSVREHNPDLFEKALQQYRDRVVQAGGTLYVPVPRADSRDQQEFLESLIVTSGDMACYCGITGGITDPATGIPQLLRLRANHPALFQDSIRRRIPTDQPAVYAIERYAKIGTERLLLVFNFASVPSRVSIDTGAINAAGYTDLLTTQQIPAKGRRMQLDLGPYQYRIFGISQISSGTIWKANRSANEVLWPGSFH